LRPGQRSGELGRKHGVDRRHRRTHAPRGEQREHHLDAVRQHRRDDVAGTDAERGEPARQTFDGGGELAGREPYPLVRDARVVGRFLRAPPRDLANVPAAPQPAAGAGRPKKSA
jgi:hypothetical protein